MSSYLNKKRILVNKCYMEITEKNEKVRVYLKPSEMLNIVDSYMRVMLTIENYGEYQKINLLSKFKKIMKLIIYRFF